MCTDTFIPYVYQSVSTHNLYRSVCTEIDGHREGERREAADVRQLGS